MSEFVELGGYIVSGDTLLNHDVSLSGNGTFESPLGLSNGGELYNTVSTNSGNWNESYNALSGTSANWNNTRSTVASNSAAWLKNETVIYNGTAVTGCNSNVSLASFDRLRIYMYLEGDNPLPVIELKYNYVMSFGYDTGVANSYHWCVYATASTGHLGLVRSKRVSFGSFTSTANITSITCISGIPKFTKLVGVK